MNKSEKEQQVDNLISFAKDFDTKVSREVNGAPLDRTLGSYLIICNYIRLSELFHSIIALASERLPSGCFVIIRTMTENYVHLRGCVKDPSFHEAYLKRHLDKKRDRLNKIKSDLASIRLEMTEEQRAAWELEQQGLRDEFTGKTLPDARQVFKELGQTELYHLVFNHCSLWVHNDSHTFENYILETPEGLQLCDYKRQAEDTATCLLMALKLFYLAYEDICGLLKREPTHREDFARKYNEFDAWFGKSN